MLATKANAAAMLLAVGVGSLAPSLLTPMALATDPQEAPLKILVAKTGSAPFLSVSPKGQVYLVYKGSEREGASPKDANGLYFTTAAAIDGPFQPPVKVRDFHTLLAGMRRGPRVASSGKTILVTGVERDKFVIQSFRSEDGGKTWSDPVRVNSPRSKNGEGLYDMTVSPMGSFHVVWLDERVPGEAHIWHASSTDGGRSWIEKNVYPADNRSVCECCWPFITADDKGQLYVFFRNNLEDKLLGNIRDMHLISSSDDGKTWQATSQKMPGQSWTLNACPVQGGAMTFLADGEPVAIWTRQGEVFLSGIATGEKSLGNGKNPYIAPGPDGAYVIWEEGSGEKATGAIWAKVPKGKVLLLREKDTSPAGGRFKTASMVAGHAQAGVIAAWEADGGIYAAVLAKQARRGK
jgi:hypothetical protein